MSKENANLDALKELFLLVASKVERVEDCLQRMGDELEGMDRPNGVSVQYIAKQQAHAVVAVEGVRELLRRIVDQCL